ncbi:GFA family protein [uncultured Parasphingorhabdus sp.]|uniref:GFA family protein n=1 Tax=uncultured Parasphingorhabdus sp. TaxID=2709694 RepID=UPI0030DA83C4
MKGQCHCGAVQIMVATAPAEVLRCNCSLCRKTGWRGGYWHPDAVAVEAERDALTPYVQGDRMITSWICKTCGCFTRWTPITASPERMGVNMRMFEPEEWQHLPVRDVDGASF